MNIFKSTIVTALSLLTICSASAKNTPTHLTETTDLVMAGKKYITLLGDQVNVGEKAPNFKVVNESFSPVRLNDFKNKNILISVVPSLDTGICSIQTKRFNEEVTNLSKNITMLTISNDLPFAQKRFCATEKIKNMVVLSDAVWRDFGQKYGLLIKDMGLLTRAVFIINTEGKIVYKDLVNNISQHPNYDAALIQLRLLESAKEEEEVNKALDNTK